MQFFHDLKTQTAVLLVINFVTTKCFIFNILSAVGNGNNNTTRKSALAQ